MEKRVINIADASRRDREEVDLRFLSGIVGIDRDERIEHLPLFARSLVARRHVVAWLFTVFALEIRMHLLLSVKVSA